MTARGLWLVCSTAHVVACRGNSAISKYAAATMSSEKLETEWRAFFQLDNTKRGAVFIGVMSENSRGAFGTRSFATNIGMWYHAGDGRVRLPYGWLPGFQGRVATTGSIIGMTVFKSDGGNSWQLACQFSVDGVAQGPPVRFWTDACLPSRLSLAAEVVLVDAGDQVSYLPEVSAADVLQQRQTATTSVASALSMHHGDSTRNALPSGPNVATHSVQYGPDVCPGGTAMAHTMHGTDSALLERLLLRSLSDMASELQLRALALQLVDNLEQPTIVAHALRLFERVLASGAFAVARLGELEWFVSVLDDVVVHHPTHPTILCGVLSVVEKVLSTPVLLAQLLPAAAVIRDAEASKLDNADIIDRARGRDALPTQGEEEEKGVEASSDETVPDPRAETARRRLAIISQPLRISAIRPRVLPQAFVSSMQVMATAPTVACALLRVLQTTATVFGEDSAEWRAALVGLDPDLSTADYAGNSRPLRVWTLAVLRQLHRETTALPGARHFTASTVVTGAGPTDGALPRSAQQVGRDMATLAWWLHASRMSRYIHDWADAFPLLCNASAAVLESDVPVSLRGLLVTNLLPLSFRVTHHVASMARAVGTLLLHAIVHAPKKRYRRCEVYFNGTSLECVRC